MLLQFKPMLRKKLEEIKRQKSIELEKLPPCYKTDLEKNQVFWSLSNSFKKELENVVECNNPSKKASENSASNKNLSKGVEKSLRGEIKKILDNH